MLIRDWGVRNLRVTHPSAMLSKLSIRLACMRPAASVRSEPGSNSPIECLIVKKMSDTWLFTTPRSLYSKVHERELLSAFQRPSQNMLRNTLIDIS